MCAQQDYCIKIFKQKISIMALGKLKPGIGIGVNSRRGGGGSKNIPTSLAVSWVDDYAALTFDDTNDGTNYYEIYESKDGGTTYTYLGRSIKGATSYNAYTWQGIDVYLKVRARGGEFADAVHVVSPIVWKSDQSTLNLAKFDNLNIAVGNTINIDWDDGTNDDYTGTNTGTATHTYSVTKDPYYIKLSGDLNAITQLYMQSWNKIYCDTSKWILPSSLSAFRMAASAGYEISGYLENFITHLPMRYLTLAGFTPINSDLSSSYINGNIQQLSLIDCGITELPPKNYKVSRSPSSLIFTDNDISTLSIQSWLSLMEIYFTAYPPTLNCIFRFEGSTMGIISQTDSIVVSIKDLFTNASKTATFYTYSPKIAYIDRSSTEIISLDTYDGSGQTIHPSALNYGSAWNGYQYWLGDTPYFNNIGTYERFSLFASNDGKNWEIPTGGSNPAFDFVHADDDIFIEDGIMYCVMINGFPKLGMTYSSDGINWNVSGESGGLITIYDGTGDSIEPVSPSLVKIDGTFYIYFVDNNNPSARTIKRISCATIDGTYGNVETISLTNPSVAQFWHIDVLLIDSKIYILAPTAAGSKNLVFAVSDDGINFTREADDDIIELEGAAYRPTMMYIGSQLVIFYSVATENRVYKVNAFLVE
jgi:hypothetical protein